MHVNPKLSQNQKHNLKILYSQKKKVKILYSGSSLTKRILTVLRWTFLSGTDMFLPQVHDGKEHKN